MTPTPANPIARHFLPVLLVVALLLQPLAAAEWQYDDVDRVVAMADVHGAYGAMTETLENAGVLDDSGAWIGGTTHLVICGDILDRGPDSRAAMDLLMRLEGEAEAAGGRVHVLIGNHEAMNLVGDLRYVAKEEYLAFADEESVEERDRWFAAWSERSSSDDVEPAELRARFDERFPSGFFAHRRAFASDGHYGAWLLDKPIIVVINGTAFVHGGVSPMIGDIGLDGVNGRLMKELEKYVRHYETLVEAGLLLPTDNFYNHPRIVDSFVALPTTPIEVVAAVDGVIALAESDIHAGDGPLWYRGNVFCCRLIEEARMNKSLAAIGAERVVIGHTPTPGRQVLQRFDGGVIEIDTGMLNNYYRGQGHALLIEGDQVQVVAQSSPERLAPLPHPRRVGARSGGSLSASDLETLLESGEIANQREDDSGRSIVTVSDGSRSVDALLAERVSRGFFPDAAAYRLDKMLELDMVPVAVVREVDGKESSLQFLPAKWVDEQQRSASGRGGSANCPLNDQWAAMYVFDSLIHNEGRSLARMLYSTDIWQLILVGHDNAFATRRGKPRHLANVPLELNDGWRAALQALDEDDLQAELEDVLPKRRISALLRRRDELLEGD